MVSASRQMTLEKAANAEESHCKQNGDLIKGDL